MRHDSRRSRVNSGTEVRHESSSRNGSGFAIRQQTELMKAFVVVPATAVLDQKVPPSPDSFAASKKFNAAGWSALGAPSEHKEGCSGVIWFH